MSVEERHLLNKIRFFEDMLLRSKDYRQQENIGKELTVMRIRLQKLRFNKMRTEALLSLSLFAHIHRGCFY